MYKKRKKKIQEKQWYWSLDITSLPCQLTHLKYWLPQLHQGASQLCCTMMCVNFRASRCHMARVCVIQLLLNIRGDLSIHGQYPSFSESNQVHFVIFRFSFIKLRYIT
jgi:hypothetical protein